MSSLSEISHLAQQQLDIEKKQQEIWSLDFVFQFKFWDESKYFLLTFLFVMLLSTTMWIGYASPTDEEDFILQQQQQQQKEKEKVNKISSSKILSYDNRYFIFRKMKGRLFRKIVTEKSCFFLAISACICCCASSFLFILKSFSSSSSSSENVQQQQHHLYYYGNINNNILTFLVALVSPLSFALIPLVLSPQLKFCDFTLNFLVSLIHLISSIYLSFCYGSTSSSNPYALLFQLVVVGISIFFFVSSMKLFIDTDMIEALMTEIPELEGLLENFFGKKMISQVLLGSEKNSNNKKKKNALKRKF